MKEENSNAKWTVVTLFVDLESLKKNDVQVRQERREVVAETEEDAHAFGLDSPSGPSKGWDLANTYVFPADE